MTPYISIFTATYNGEKYLRQCIESVLNQTYRDFEYIIYDDGSKDSTLEIAKEYEAKDSRVRVIEVDPAHRNEAGYKIPLYAKMTRGKYCAILDHDDWWDEHYLEELIKFADENELDIACTGTVMHWMDFGEFVQGFRKIDETVVLNRFNFANMYPLYHQFFRTNWGKVIRSDVMKRTDYTLHSTAKLNWGPDTIAAFAALRQCKKIGILKQTLHHYRVFKKSYSNKYDPKRFMANVILYQDAEDFLSAFGPISEQNRDFMSLVFANELLDTVKAVVSPNVKEEDRLVKYHEIVTHPVTQQVFQREHEVIRKDKMMCLTGLLLTEPWTKEEKVQFLECIQVLAPHCAGVVSLQTKALFMQEKALLSSLLYDDHKQLARDLLGLIVMNDYADTYDLVGMFKELVKECPVLNEVTEEQFIRKYEGICKALLDEQYLWALDTMTGIILEKDIQSDREAFLQTYILLAAGLQQEAAYIFGYVQLAKELFGQNRYQECSDILKELVQLGVEENEEIAQMQEQLQREKL